MSVPAQQMQNPEGQMPVNQLSDEDEKDIDIAVARALEFLSSNTDGPSGEEVLSKLLSGKNPEQQLALFFTQMIEAIMTEAQDAGLELNPVIWFAEGGAIDEIANEMDDMMGGGILDMMPAVKEQIRTMLGQRGEELRAQMEGGQQPQLQGAPQQPPADDRPPLLARG